MLLSSNRHGWSVTKLDSQLNIDKADFGHLDDCHQNGERLNLNLGKLGSLLEQF